MRAGDASQRLFRIWLAEFGDWRPATWQDLPPQAKALEPAMAACVTARDAALYVEGFNTTALTRQSRVWAIAVPVAIEYRGDVAAGAPFTPELIVAN